MASPTTKVIRNARRRGVKIYTRRQWGNTSGVYMFRRMFRKHKQIGQGKKTDTIWAHCSVTRRSNIKADMRHLHQIGMDRFQSGVSYNFGVDHITGEIGLGQALDAAGTHTLNEKEVPGYSFNQNYVSVAFCWIGVPGFRASHKSLQAVAKVLAAMMEEGYLTLPGKGYDLKPHSFVAAKECPTDTVRDRLHIIYAMAAQEFHQNTGRTPRQRKKAHQKANRVPTLEFEHDQR